MSILADVLDALSVRFTAAVAATEAKVYDGPDRAALTDGKRLLVFIGTDGEALMEPDADDSDGIVVDEELSAVGPGTWRDVAGTVTCAVWAHKGDPDMRSRVREADDIASACIASVTSDRTLGGLLVANGLADVTGRGFRLRHTSKGAVARAVFTVRFTALDAS